MKKFLLNFPSGYELFKIKNNPEYTNDEIELIASFFDHAFYKKQLDVDGNEDLLKHFLYQGYKDDLNPCECFDSKWYQSTFNVDKKIINPFLHFCKYGVSEGKDPSHGFSVNFYLDEYPDVKESGINPLLHYIKFGKNEGRLPNQKEKNQALQEKEQQYQEEIAALNKALQKAKQENENEKKARKSVETGAIELKKELEKIKQKNQELQQKEKQSQKKIADLNEETNLLTEQLHYVQELCEEKINREESTTKQIEQLNQSLLEKDRKIESLDQRLLEAGREIESFKQLNENSIVYQGWLKANLNEAYRLLFNKSWGFKNKIKQQAKILRNKDLFDVEWYLNNYAEAEEMQLDPVVHYLLYGATKGYNPSNQFHTLHYLYSYPDVAEKGMQPIIHFIQFGQFEGRKPDPMQKHLPAPEAVK